MRVRWAATEHARGLQLILACVTSPPSRNPRRADAEHSFIVTVMKPVVYVPWYQVLPRILSGGDLALS